MLVFALHLNTPPTQAPNINKTKFLESIWPIFRTLPTTIVIKNHHSFIKIRNGGSYDFWIKRNPFPLMMIFLSGYVLLLLIPRGEGLLLTLTFRMKDLTKLVRYRKIHKFIMHIKFEGGAISQNKGLRTR
jgi:hypothetical protein